MAGTLSLREVAEEHAAEQMAAAVDPAAKRDELIARFRQQLGALHAAAHFGIDDVINPRDTRAALLATLERCPPRHLHGVLPRRRHAISPR